jgi:hypothetical protein
MLQSSHLIGRAMYKMSRERGLAPVVMTPELATHTSKQVRDYVFCSDCEDRFNKGGEKYVTSLVYNGKSFPLLDRINLASLAGKRANQEGLMQYSGKKMGIDTGKLTYYAVSVVWRSAAQKWKTLGNQTTSIELSDSRKEQFRRYLLGRIGLPHDVGVVVTVCTDLASQGLFFVPTLTKGSAFTTYSVLVRGVYFRILVDLPGRFPIHHVCCVHSPERVIWVNDCFEKTKHSFKALNAMAKVAENLKRH